MSLLAMSASFSSSSSSSSSSGMVFSCNLLRSAVIFVLLSALIMSHIDMASAKSLAFQDDLWSTTPELSKRNSWWSKKSVDSSAKYDEFLQDPSLADPELPQEEAFPVANSDSEDISNLYQCYVRECVPNFVQCVQSRRTPQRFTSCKSTHRLCALQCWVRSTENSLI